MAGMAKKRSFFRGAGRGMALFLGGFTLLNLAGEWWSPGFDSNLWWMDVRFLPRGVGMLLLFVAALVLIDFGVTGTRRRWTWAVIAVLGGIAMLNAGLFFERLVMGTIVSGMPLPLSLLLFGALALIFSAAGMERGGPEWREIAMALTTCAACMVLFPLAQMYCFGMTDYRRNADAIVVFGALAYADGTPSQALADRVNTAIDLYQDGMAPVLIFSGGRGLGSVTEPEAMKRVALARGVREQNIVLDNAGLNSAATVKNSCWIFRERGFKTVIAVSHFYHLPRVKMAYQRELHSVGGGCELVTVPARETRPLVAMPRFMAREVVALWAYYLRPLVGA